MTKVFFCSAKKKKILWMISRQPWAFTTTTTILQFLLSALIPQCTVVSFLTICRISLKKINPQKCFPKWFFSNSCIFFKYNYFYMRQISFSVCCPLCKGAKNSNYLGHLSPVVWCEDTQWEKSIFFLYPFKNPELIYLKIMS